MSWPPKAGELLPGAAEPDSIRDKLVSYCLNPAHEQGGPKAHGFARLLGISADDVEHLARVIEAGVAIVPISAVRDNAPYGVNCVVDVPVRSLNLKPSRVVGVRTVWEIAYDAAQPRLVTAYTKT